MTLLALSALRAAPDLSDAAEIVGSIGFALVGLGLCIRWLRRFTRRHYELSVPTWIERGFDRLAENEDSNAQ